MKHVSLPELSDHLRGLLDEVARGEEITILRDGKPVARIVATAEEPVLVPEYSPEEMEKRRESVRRIRDSAREMNSSITHDEIRAWIEEGRG